MKKGSKMTFEQRKKISDACKGHTAWNKGKPAPWSKHNLFPKGHVPWNKGTRGVTKGWPRGRRMSEEHRYKLSLSHRGVRSGEKHHNWKGGKTSSNLRIRNSGEYREWRMMVLKRDRFSCVNCGYRSKKSKVSGYEKCDIRVDHIKPFSLYPELRFSVENGRTLCLSCDGKLGWNFKREQKALESIEK